jgi:hypothetical protein
MKGFFGHLKTVCTHKLFVFIECCKVGLVWQGLIHDLSKFSPTEFLISAKYWTGVSTPIREERKDKGYSITWPHHYHRNKHHWDYWIDIENGKTIPIPMPEKYILEMFCDMVAASKTYNGKNFNKEMPLEFFKKEEQNYIMTAETKDLLEFYLKDYAEHGNLNLK